MIIELLWIGLIARLSYIGQTEYNYDVIEKKFNSKLDNAGAMQYFIEFSNIFL